MNTNINKYLNNKESEYITPKIVIPIIEDTFKKNIETLRQDIQNSKVKLSKNDIEIFLNEQFNTKDKETKERLKNKKTRPKKFSDWTEEDKNSLNQELIDTKTAQKYIFDSYILEYFQTYISTLKTKTLILLHIVEKLGNCEFDLIKNALINLDITILKGKFISYNDLERILIPTIHNIRNLLEKTKAANTLETYLDFNLPFYENELYPSANLQSNNIYQNNLPGYIPLSKKQIKDITQKERENIKYWTKTLTEKTETEEKTKVLINKQ